MASRKPLPAVSANLPPSVIPCDRQKQVHAVAARQMWHMSNGNNVSCRAVCGRKIRPPVDFSGAADICEHCRANVPDLTVPASGNVLTREMERIFSAAVGRRGDVG